MGPGDAEARVVEVALARGWVTRGQVEQARADCAGRGGQGLLGLLRERHLSPEQAVALGRVHQDAVSSTDRRWQAPPLELRIGPYRVIGELGRGGMGIVYRAAGPDGVERALKVLVADGGGVRRARFAREVNVLTFVGRHQNVVSLHESGEEGGQPWLAMDLVTGGSLADRLERTPRDVRALVADLAAVANALHFAHEAGVLHRDVKPSNVLYDAQGTPCLADFGLAADREEDVERLTQTGELLGTIGYMAPEQLRRSSRTLDRRVDVYALGTVLYEVLTGQTPYEGPPLAVLSKILSDEPAPAPSEVAADVSPALEAVCLRAMAKDPAERTSTAAALQAELLAWLGGEAQARSGAAVTARPARGRRGAGLAALTLAAAAVGLGGLAVGTRWLAGAEARAEAVELEARALGDPRREPAASDEAALLRVVQLDPGRARAWAALGALALARGDRARAAECLARSAAPEDDLRAARLAAALAEAEGRDDAARDAALLALLGGDVSAPTEARLARCAARVAEREGLRTTAEGLRWHALRADPADPAPLLAVVQARLDVGDVDGLSAVWIELRRVLAGPSLGDLVREARARGAPTPAAALLDALARLDPPPGVDRAPPPVDPADLAPSMPLARRLLAALDAAEHGSPGTDLVRALEEMVVEAPPLLAEAARSSLVALEARHEEDVPPALLATPWPALTLLEGAARRTQAPGAAVLRAPSPMVRAAAALATAIAATRGAGLEAGAARRVLDGMQGDGDPLVRTCARRARAALGLLLEEPAGPVDPPLDVVLLAWSLVRLPRALAEGDRLDAWREGLTARLAARTESEALLARALDAVAAGDLAAARDALFGVDAADPRGCGLRAAIAALRGEPPPTVRDPLAAARAATLAAVAAGTGVVCTPAAGGALRVDVAFGTGRAFPDRLLERWSVTEPATGSDGLALERPVRLRARLALARVDALAVQGSATGWALSLGARDGQYTTTLTDTHDLRAAGRMLSSAPRPTGVVASLGLWRSRGRLLGVSGGARLEARSPQRDADPIGREASIISGWPPAGRGRLRHLTLVGVWAGRFEPAPPAEWPAPPPLPPRQPLTTRHALSSVTDLAGLTRAGLTLSPAGAWVGTEDKGGLAFVVSLVGDVEVRARLAIPLLAGEGERVAGLALRDGSGETFARIGLRSSDVEPDPHVWLSLQRGGFWEWPASGARWAPGAPICLRLRRRGDLVSFSAGASFDQLEEVGSPVVFPLGPVVSACLFTHRWGTGEMGVARFDEVEVRGTTTLRLE